MKPIHGDEVRLCQHELLLQYQGVTHHIEAIRSKVLDDPIEPGHGV